MAGRGKKILIGCAAIPVLAVVATIAVVLIFVVVPAPSVKMVRPTAQQPIEVAAPAERLRLMLSEGEFQIVPDIGGSAITADGEYDAGSYAFQVSDGGGERVVRFRRTTIMLQFAKRPEHTPPNRLRVRIPDAVPLDLTLELSKGEFDVDLSGLPLRHLRVEHAMGETRLAFHAPNPIAMERLELSMRMGQVELSGLGHAGFAALDAKGRMGEMALDFSGGAARPAACRVAMFMGEAALTIPAERPWTVSSRAAFLGGVIADPPEFQRTGSTELPEGPLDLSLKATFGEVSVRSRETGEFEAPDHAQVERP